MTAGEIILRVVLLLGGAFAVFTGADFAGGGIRSLGLDGAPLAISFDDAHAFYERDSHTRFVGGVWLGVGLVFMASAVWLHALSTALLASIAMIFIGGVARFTTDHPEVLLSPGVAGALVAELIGMPVLFYWVTRVRAGTRAIGVLSPDSEEVLLSPSIAGEARSGESGIVYSLA